MVSPVESVAKSGHSFNCSFQWAASLVSFRLSAISPAACKVKRMQARSKFVVSVNQASGRLSLISGELDRGSFRFPSFPFSEMFSK